MIKPKNHFKEFQRIKMSLLGFSYKSESDLELRSCNDMLTSSGKHTRAEIVQWKIDDSGEEYCFTVASWKKTKDSFDLVFVGNRPFKVNTKDFMELAKQGQYHLTGE